MLLIWALKKISEYSAIYYDMGKPINIDVACEHNKAYQTLNYIRKDSIWEIINAANNPGARFFPLIFVVVVQLL